MKLLRLLGPKTGEKPPAIEPMVVVVGLRNPGAKYDGTRHNIGFEVIKRVAARADSELGRAPSRVNAAVVKITGERPAMLVAPYAYMNQSGGVVRAALNYWKVPPEDLLVVHDDIDLAFGRLRVQVAGGSGGHNGIRSLERDLGTKNFSRLKVGVGRPPGDMDPAAYVLRGFTKKEEPEVGVLVEDGADVVDMWIDDRVRAQEMAAHRGRDS